MSKICFKCIKLNKFSISIFVLGSLALNVQAVNSKTIEELFMNSLIADVIYVDLPEMNISDFENTLLLHKDWINEKDRVTIVTDNFELLDFQPDTDSGFSGGMFKHLKGTHKDEIIYASRGTAGVTDDIAVADVYGIVAMGVPQFQVRDLYNYIQRLKAPNNGDYTYLKNSFFEEYKLEFGTKSDGAGHADWFGYKSVDGLGHSLGGNLTSAFGRLYSNNAKDSYTYNSAGSARWLLPKIFARLSLTGVFKLDEDEFYQVLGGTTDYNNYQVASNVYAKDGLAVTSGNSTHLQTGDRFPINIELAPSQLIDSVGGHSVKYLSDALAVAWNFNHIDQTFTLADHSAFMDAAGIDEAQDLENLTNGLHELVIGSENNELWEGIYNISKEAKSSGVITSLVDLSPAEILSIYNQSDAIKERVIYSAFKGLPFVYDGGSSYTSFDDPDDFSRKAIYDLAGMLAVELKSNVDGDNSASDIASIGNIVFTKPNGTVLINTVATDNNQTYVVFDEPGGNTLTGTGETDRLYGLADVDTLYGFAGDDHLEGGLGTDTLNGGDDDDTLLGGKGDDTLEGEKGKDILDGGEGNDTYVFTKDSGHDQIFNFEDDKSDDLGIIKYENEVVDGAGAIRKSDNVHTYYNKEKKIRYILIEETLTIQFEENETVQASVTIPKFTNGNLGINLSTDVEVVEDTTDFWGHIT